MQERRGDARGELRQLVGGDVGGGDVAGRDHDLDGGRQDRRTGELITGFVEHAADARGGRVDLPFGQAQKGQPRFRFPAGARGFPVRPLGSIEFALQPVQLRLLIVRDADGGMRRLREPRACAARLHNCL